MPQISVYNICIHTATYLWQCESCDVSLTHLNVLPQPISESKYFRKSAKLYIRQPEELFALTFRQNIHRLIKYADASFLQMQYKDLYIILYRICFLFWGWLAVYPHLLRRIELKRFYLGYICFKNSIADNKIQLFAFEIYGVADRNAVVGFIAVGFYAYLYA